MSTGLIEYMRLNSLINGLALPVAVLLIVALVVGICLSVFNLINSEDGSIEEPISTNTQNAYSVNDIIDAEIFGSVNDADTTTVERLENTTLNLTLVGIVFDETEPSESFARIAQGSQRAKRFQAGDRIAGVANLSEVLRDRVILERMGKRELLAFEREHEIFELVEYESPLTPVMPDGGNYVDQSELNSENEPEQATTEEGSSDLDNEEDSDSEPNQMEELLNSYQDRLEDDPAGILDEWGLTPISEEAAEGYLIDANLATTLGLQNGDIVKSVNGVAVGLVNEDFSNVRDTLTESSVELEIQRGNETISFEINVE